MITVKQIDLMKAQLEREFSSPSLLIRKGNKRITFYNADSGRILGTLIEDEMGNVSAKVNKGKK